jgi:hypothetical protein
MADHGWPSWRAMGAPWTGYRSAGPFHKAPSPVTGGI